MNWPANKNHTRAISEHAAQIYELEGTIQKLQEQFRDITVILGNRLDKLEKLERITANVARERAQRPKNWTQFRTMAEGAEEPNARG